MIKCVLIKLCSETALVADVKDQLGLFILVLRGRRADGKWMSRDCVYDAKAREAQEAMLAWCPMELGWDRNANKAVVFDRNLALLSPPVLKDGAKPRVDKTRNIDGRRRDEVMPTGQCVVTMPEEGNHEHDNTGKMCNLEELVPKVPVSD